MVVMATSGYASWFVGGVVCMLVGLFLLWVGIQIWRAGEEKEFVVVDCKKMGDLCRQIADELDCTAWYEVHEGVFLLLMRWEWGTEEYRIPFNARAKNLRVDRLDLYYYRTVDVSKRL